MDMNRLSDFAEIIPETYGVPVGRLPWPQALLMISAVSILSWAPIIVAGLMAMKAFG
jgi:hypothetical protein